MTGINVYSLVVEVTRQCNLNCDHCLRGDAQDLVMKPKTVQDILAAVDRIDHVTFTGGEPALYPEVIDRFMHEADAAGKLPTSFYVVTNGTVNQLELARVLLRWYPFMDCEEAIGVSISVDQFHDNEHRGADYLKGLSFYRDDKNMSGTTRLWWVLDRGRAHENGIGCNHRPVNALSYECDDDGITLDMLYVAANGKIAWDCDLDYESIDASPYRITGLRRAISRVIRDEAASSHS